MLSTRRAARSLLFLGLPFLVLPRRALADCATPSEVRLVVAQGSDAAEGSLDAPWRTIAHAIENTGPGACVLVGTGLYDEGSAPLVIPADRGGAEGAVWELMSFPAFEANVGTPIMVDASFVRIHGINFVEGAFVHTDALGTGRAIDSNTFVGAPALAAIRIGGSDTLARDNILDLSSNDAELVGVLVGAGTNLLVENNRIQGANGAGIRLAIDGAGSVQGLALERNVVLGGRIGVDLGAADDALGADVVLRANIIVESEEAAIAVGAGVSDVGVLGNTLVASAFGLSNAGQASITARNNIFWKQSEAATSGKVLVTDTNLYGPGDTSSPQDANALAADPLFEGEADLDFRLREGSPAIDAGADLGMPFEGSAPDLGALESGPFPTPSGSGGSGPNTGGGGIESSGGGGSEDSGGAGDGVAIGGGCTCELGRSAANAGWSWPLAALILGWGHRRRRGSQRALPTRDRHPKLY